MLLLPSEKHPFLLIIVFLLFLLLHIWGCTLYFKQLLLFVRFVVILKLNKFHRMGGSPDSWLWEETHVPMIVGLNPNTVYWMDIFSHIFVVKIIMFV